MFLFELIAKYIEVLGMYMLVRIVVCSCIWCSMLLNRGVICVIIFGFGVVVLKFRFLLSVSWVWLSRSTWILLGVRKLWIMMNFLIFRFVNDSIFIGFLFWLLLLVCCLCWFIYCMGGDEVWGGVSDDLE